MLNNRIPLRNGSKIAIIGGGPAGSFFANFALRLARKMGLEVSITIFETRNFTRAGRSACNMSVGVLAERLRERLDQEDIQVPPRCIQTEIERYSFFTQDDHLQLHHPEPGHKPRIVTVFRGAGPVHSHYTEDISFDNFLLRLVERRGARVIPQEVKDVILPSHIQARTQVLYGDGEELPADLVVGAFGLNTLTIEHFGKKGFGYVPPRTIKSCILDVPLGKEAIAATCNKTIHVFALGMKEIEFASITPRGDYLTIAVVGRRDINISQVKEFLSHPVVLKILPQGPEMLKNCCICFPKISVSTPFQPYSDRLVIIGDAGVSRSYKNGIESAFVVAELAAQTAFREGVSKEAFERGYYKPARKIFARDNLYGKLMFRTFDLVASQRRVLTERLEYARVHRERWIAHRINEGLWNLVTGDAPYKEVFFELFSLRLQISLLSVTLYGLIKQKFGIK